MAHDLPTPPLGGLLLGLGTDLVDIERIRGIRERQGDRFLHKVFTDEELAYCLPLADPAKHLAARFAAKEAASKAFGTGIGAEVGWKSFSVFHGPRHEPKLRLDAQASALLAHFGGSELLLSLSHTDTTALAVVVVVKHMSP